MKNTLAENLLRFGVKNLSESSKQKLQEITEQDVLPFRGESAPLENFLYSIREGKRSNITLYGSNNVLEPLIDTIRYNAADPTKNRPEFVSVSIADRMQNVNWSLIITKEEIRPTKVNKINITGVKPADSTMIGPGSAGLASFQKSVGQDILMNKANYQTNLSADHVLKKIQALLA